MAFVAVDQNGEEWIYERNPTRGIDSFCDVTIDGQIELPSGSIKKLIGRDLTWDDEPVELK